MNLDLIPSDSEIKVGDGVYSMKVYPPVDSLTDKRKLQVQYKIVILNKHMTFVAYSLFANIDTFIVGREFRCFSMGDVKIVDYNGKEVGLDDDSLYYIYECLKQNLKKIEKIL